MHPSRVILKIRTQSPTRVAGRVRRSGLLQTLARDVQRPQPSLVSLPGLHQKPVWSESEFSWSAALKAGISTIREDYEKVSRSGVLKNDYGLNDGELQLHSGGSASDGDSKNRTSAGDSWEWISYIQKGERQAHFAAHCEGTADILESVPTLMAGVPFGYAFFSTLQPGAVIASHAGPSNLRLRVHVPIDVPADQSAVLTVAGMQMPWKENELLIFDDSFVHSVKNEGKTPRTILLFDTWQPDLSLEERDACIGVFEEAKSQGWIQKQVPCSDVVAQGQQRVISRLERQLRPVWVLASVELGPACKLMLCNDLKLACYTGQYKTNPRKYVALHSPHICGARYMQHMDAPRNLLLYLNAVVGTDRLTTTSQDAHIIALIQA